MLRWASKAKTSCWPEREMTHLATTSYKVLEGFALLLLHCLFNPESLLSWLHAQFLICRRLLPTWRELSHPGPLIPAKQRAGVTQLLQRSQNVRPTPPQPHFPEPPSWARIKWRVKTSSAAISPLHLLSCGSWCRVAQIWSCIQRSGSAAVIG